MTTPQRRWEHVAALGLTSLADSPDDDQLPGALDIYCHRTPTSNLQDTPFAVRLENNHTGEHVAVTINRGSLLAIAHVALQAALKAHPVDIDPHVYFMRDGEVA